MPTWIKDKYGEKAYRQWKHIVDDCEKRGTSSNCYALATGKIQDLYGGKAVEFIAHKLTADKLTINALNELKKELVDCFKDVEKWQKRWRKRGDADVEELLDIINDIHEYSDDFPQFKEVIRDWTHSLDGLADYVLEGDQRNAQVYSRDAFVNYGRVITAIDAAHKKLYMQERGLRSYDDLTPRTRKLMGL